MLTGPPGRHLGDTLGILTLDIDRRIIASSLHQTTQQNGDISDMAFGKGGRILEYENDVTHGWLLGTYSQHMECNVSEGADNVDIKCDLGSSHIGFYGRCSVIEARYFVLQLRIQHFRSCRGPSPQ